MRVLRKCFRSLFRQRDGTFASEAAPTYDYLIAPFSADTTLMMPIDEGRASSSYYGKTILIARSACLAHTTIRDLGQTSTTRTTSNRDRSR